MAFMFVLVMYKAIEIFDPTVVVASVISFSVLRCRRRQGNSFQLLCLDQRQGRRFHLFCLQYRLQYCHEYLR